MHTKPLTKIQQGWLNHVHQATEQGQSMSAYAKQNDLSLKAFYNARAMLIKKEALPPIANSSLITVTATPSQPESTITSCRITLCNGVSIEFTDANIDSLLNAASRL